MSRRQHEPNGDNLPTPIQTRDDEKVSWHPWANDKNKSVTMVEGVALAHA